MTHTYSFYVGSTDTYHAHTHPVPAGTPLAAAVSFCGYVRHVWGYWDGEREAVAEFVGQLPTDRDAMRVAHTLAVLTGNDAILVTRAIGEAVYIPAYRAQRVMRQSGDRTLYGEGPEGYAFQTDYRGDDIAFLVWADSSVTPVGYPA